MLILLLYLSTFAATPQALLSDRVAVRNECRLEWTRDRRWRCERVFRAGFEK